MDIQDLGAIGELVGSALILVTLIYVAVQIKLSRKEMADAAEKELLDAFIAVNQSIVSSEEIALLYVKGLEQPQTLTRAEQIRFQMLVRQILNPLSASILRPQGANLEVDAATGVPRQSAP